MANVGDAESARKQQIILSKSELLDQFVQPDWLVQGILQRGFLYALTAKTGHSKTALALLISRLISCASIDNPMLGSHYVRKGRVLYFAGENVDDLIYRIIGMDGGISDEDSNDRIHFIPMRVNIVDHYDLIAFQAAQLGDIDFIVVDTSAAYFVGDDENSNIQSGDWARNLRRLTQLRGKPCVVVLCHPIKHAQSADQLLPRGGGAFIAEIDANLTLWPEADSVYSLHYNKIRGPSFEPMLFRIEPVTAPELVDASGQQFYTVRCVNMSEEEADKIRAGKTADEDHVLRIMLRESGLSVNEIGKRCELTKTKAQRALETLKKAGLVDNPREHYELTAKGRKQAERIALDTIDP